MLMQRDSFARQELHREEVKAPPGGCVWCGSANKRGNCYRYRTETDGGRVFYDPPTRLFCSAACRRSYDGE